MRKKPVVHFTGKPYELISGQWWHPYLCGGRHGTGRAQDLPQTDESKVTCKNCLRWLRKQEEERT